MCSASCVSHRNAGTATFKGVTLTSRFTSVQTPYTLNFVGKTSVTLTSRCEECEGRLNPRPRTLCDAHSEARRKEKARLRALRYRRRKQGLPETAGLTLTAQEATALRDITVDLLQRENDMRAWAATQHRDNTPIPPVVTKYFEAAVRARKALTGLTDPT